MADNDYDREMTEALQSAETAEVVCIILPIIDQCLVYDSRSAPDDPPRISVSAPLGSGERRLRHVNRARPDLPRTHELSVIPWTGTIEAFSGSRVWELLERRMNASGFEGTEEQCASALSELRQWERRSMMAMIQGQGPYHTIWSRTGD